MNIILINPIIKMLFEMRCYNYLTCISIGYWKEKLAWPESFNQINQNGNKSISVLKKNLIDNYK